MRCVQSFIFGLFLLQLARGEDNILGKSLCVVAAKLIISTSSWMCLATLVIVDKKNRKKSKTKDDRHWDFRFEILITLCIYLILCISELGVERNRTCQIFSFGISLPSFFSTKILAMKQYRYHVVLGAATKATLHSWGEMTYSFSRGELHDIKIAQAVVC